MEVLAERCCGLDVHQKTVVACLLVGVPGAKPTKQVRTFRTFTRDLVELRDWLKAEGCTHVAMESTGVYWKPVYAVLEGHFEVIVGNAQRMRNVPGRKTDMKDAEWIATLLRHGLIAPSFVPPPPIRELRDLVRYRTKLVQARSAEHNRLLKLLETANIKLASVASNVFGVSGVLMLKALIAGKTDAQEIAELARGRLRKKLGALRLALEGRIEEHHRFILEMQIERIQEIEAHVAKLDERLFAKLEPYAEIYARLTEIPGVDRIVAAVIIAELGVDMTVFADEHHLASWAGVCPGNNESAGKRKSGRARKGNPHLRAVLVQAATGAGRTGGTYLKDKYHRLRARRGPKRAALAVAHKILISAYHLIRGAVPYRELGAAYLDDMSRHRTTRSLVRRLERMGYRVDLQKAA